MKFVNNINRISGKGAWNIRFVDILQVLTIVGWPDTER